MKYFAVCLLALACTAQAETLIGYVVTIADGDTLTLLDASRQQHKIRLAGIDAPALTFDKHVTVEWNKRDRYGRSIGKIMVNSIDSNLEQVKAGMAWWYRDYAKEQAAADRITYEQAEAMARQQKLGLWREINPMPPWEFRHGGAQLSSVTEPCPCGSAVICTGPKGGHYCMTESGGKRYK